MALQAEPASAAEIAALLEKCPRWSVRESMLERRAEFSSYLDGVEFARRVVGAAEEANHHPEIVIGYKKVTVRWWTHKFGGIGRGDIEMATRTERLLEEFLRGA